MVSCVFVSISSDHENREQECAFVVVFCVGVIECVGVFECVCVEKGGMESREEKKVRRMTMLTITK